MEIQRFSRSPLESFKDIPSHLSCSYYVGNIIKLVEQLKYLGRFIRSTEKDIEIRIAKARSALNNACILFGNKKCPTI